MTFIRKEDEYRAETPKAPDAREHPGPITPNPQRYAAASNQTAS
jgi:hypothetical protein